MLKKILATVAAALVFAAAVPEAGATTFTLYIHGRTGGTPSGWDYWSHGTGAYGINAVPVNYDGGAHIWDSNPTVVAYLNAYCTNGNSCDIVCHSAGCSQIGYAYSTYGAAWSVQWVATGGSAVGGTEIAGSFSSFMTGNNIDYDLSTGTMRGLYNHDKVGDYIWTYVYNHVGNDWAATTNWLFTGGNDTAVPVHSAGHYRSVTSTTNAAAPSGATYWDWSKTQWVDPNNVCVGNIFGWCSGGHSGSTGHCNSGSTFCYEGTYGGVMGKVVPFTIANAK